MPRYRNRLWNIWKWKSDSLSVGQLSGRAGLPVQRLSDHKAFDRGQESLDLLSSAGRGLLSSVFLCNLCLWRDSFPGLFSGCGLVLPGIPEAWRSGLVRGLLSWLRAGLPDSQQQPDPVGGLCAGTACIGGGGEKASPSGGSRSSGRRVLWRPLLFAYRV